MVKVRFIRRAHPWRGEQCQADVLNSFENSFDYTIYLETIPGQKSPWTPGLDTCNAAAQNDVTYPGLFGLDQMLD